MEGLTAAAELVAIRRRNRVRRRGSPELELWQLRICQKSSSADLEFWHNGRHARVSVFARLGRAPRRRRPSRIRRSLRLRPDDTKACGEAQPLV